MRVFFISHVSEKYGGGRSLLDLIDGLLKREVRCYVVIPRQGPIIEELKKRGIEYCVLPLKTWASTDKILLRRIIRAGFDLIVSLVIAIKAYFWKADIIYTNSSVIPGGAFAAFLLRKPHIWHIREFGKEHYGLKFILGEQLSIWLMNKLSFRIIVISEALKRKYSRYVSLKKIKMIYDSVSIAPYNSKIKESIFPVIAVIGWIYPNKGQADAILAAADIIKNGVKLKLKIIGGAIPQYTEQLKKIIAQNGISEYVEFTGYINDLASLYNSADIVLVCSRWEAFGRVAVEAMLSRKPVIGARSGATPELIKEGFNGLLYEPGDYQELAEKIKYLIECPGKAKEMGENGFREASGKYAIEKCASEVYNIFQEAIKNKK